MVRRYAPADAGALADGGEGLKQLGVRIERWIGKGFTKPELCFVFERDGKIIGGASFNSFESDELDLMDFAIEDSVRTDGAALLGECVRMAAGDEYRSVVYNLYNDGDSYSETKAIFLASGFLVAQEKKSFCHTSGVRDSAASGRLFYKTITETGEDAFIDAVQAVTVGTLDTEMADDALEQGGAAAARAYAEGLKNIEFEPSRWLLAYDGDGLSGLVIAQKLGDIAGAINYIGVVPEKRGRGYVREILAKGTEILYYIGVKKIIADIDLENFPLEAALIDAGYVFDCDETVLKYTGGM